MKKISNVIIVLLALYGVYTLMVGCATTLPLETCNKNDSSAVISFEKLDLNNNKNISLKEFEEFYKNKKDVGEAIDYVDWDDGIDKTDSSSKSLDDASF